MFYNSGWKSGFFTGLVTGIALYSIASTPRGRSALGKFRGVTEVLKNEVNHLSQQANDVIEATAKVADDVSRPEAGTARKEPVATPQGAYSAGNI